VGEGDRVGAIVANMPEAIVGMLAASSLGAVWSSCSPDFGVQGIFDRFGQIEPKVLIAVDGYHYNGKAIDILDKVGAVAAKLPTLTRVVVVPYLQPDPPVTAIANGGHVERLRCAVRRGAAGVQADAVQPSALHPLFERHDRRSQVHRAHRGRRPCCST
jgi:acetoacetyl-CoA synthetase